MKRFVIAAALAFAGAASMLAFQSACDGAVCLGSADPRPVYLIQDGTRRAEVTATGGLLVVPGALSGARATACGTLDSNATQVSTPADTNPLDMYTFTVKPATLTTELRGIEIVARGKFGATANTKNLFVVFAGTAIVSRSSTSNAGGWQLTGIVQRTAATTWLGSGTAWTDTTSFASVPSSNAGTWAGNLDVVIRGANGTGAAGDIVFQSAIVRCF